MWRCSQRSSNSSLHARASLHARGAHAAPAPAVEFLSSFFPESFLSLLFTRRAHTKWKFSMCRVFLKVTHTCARTIKVSCMNAPVHKLGAYCVSRSKLWYYRSNSTGKLVLPVEFDR